MKKRYLAVIPARGGSKRLPGKNLMKIGEHSLIGHAIECVKNLELVEEICVTTDDQEIATEALKYGPYVHFMRPECLATDEAKTFDVIHHAIQWFQGQDKKFDAVVLLQPTSPLRAQQHIIKAAELFESKGAQAVVSVCRVEHPPEWCAELGPDGNLGEFGHNLGKMKRSQYSAVTFRLNGAIYIYDIPELLKNDGFFYNNQTYAYKMDRFSSIDIDTFEDYCFAKYLVESKIIF